MIGDLYRIDAIGRWVTIAAVYPYAYLLSDGTTAWRADV